MPLVVQAASSSYKTYALLDDGSTKTVISEALATKLALKRTTNLAYSGRGYTEAETDGRF